MCWVQVSFFILFLYDYLSYVVCYTYVFSCTMYMYMCITIHIYVYSVIISDLIELEYCQVKSCGEFSYCTCT